MAISAVDPEPKPITIPFFTSWAADSAAICFSSTSHRIYTQNSSQYANKLIRANRNSDPCPSDIRYGGKLPFGLGVIQVNQVISRSNTHICTGIPLKT